MIVRHTDYRNSVSNPIIYTNYLAATATKDAAVEVKLCEEGDYEVALNYEIRKNNMNIFGWNPLPTYNDYRIFFRFSVRNGNCMVYPFDVATGAELTNSSITENGFYLDLARSRYLNIDIKRKYEGRRLKDLRRIHASTSLQRMAKLTPTKVSTP